MGYRIVYGEEPAVTTAERKSHLRLMTAGFALVFVILVRLCWPEGTQMLRQTLLPGDNAALEQLKEDIQAGEPIGDAVTAFCQTIVEEAVGQAD